MDASVNSLAHEIMQQLPALIDQRIAATKVQMDVDEPSFRKAKAKIKELMSCFGKWGSNPISVEQIKKRTYRPSLR